MRRGALWGIVGLTLLVQGGGCQSADRDVDVRSEGARLSQVIDRLREADNAKKQEWLVQLAAEPCSELCSVKRICEDAYRELVTALSAISEVKAYGTAIPTPVGLDEGELIAVKLEEAERRLKRSREMSTQCVEAQGAMKLRLKL